MSVFGDFQRMWMKRFPDNALSSEWENDVRSSLQRHKQKATDMTKELEQEMLYVEYLERLLSEVDAVRLAGGDPTYPIQTGDDGNGDEHIQSGSFDSLDDDKNDDSGNSIEEKHTAPSTNGVCSSLFF